MFSEAIKYDKYNSQELKFLVVDFRYVQTAILLFNCSGFVGASPDISALTKWNIIKGDLPTSVESHVGFFRLSMKGKFDVYY